MKKLSPFLALAALVPMLAACAPKPDEVCDHVIDLLKKELGDKAGEMTEDDLKGIKETCVKDAEKEKELKGALEYNKQAKCVMAASSRADLDKCDGEDEKK